jgi:hypothetical protein
MPDAVDVHCGNQPRIMDLRPRDRMAQYQSLPFGVDEFFLG